MLFYFLTEFFRYFFRVLHEASSSWLKFMHAFQKHSVQYVLRGKLKKIVLETLTNMIKAITAYSNSEFI
jgi:hypothetical protein